MNDKPAATPDSVAANAARGGLGMEEATIQRIARAVSPALAAFDLPSLRLPMAEEPSNWSVRARPESRPEKRK